MKILVGVLSGLGIASLLMGAALWIHGQTIVQRTREICGILQQQHERIVADLVRGSSPDVDVVLPLMITNLRTDMLQRGPEFGAYCKATWGFALMFCMLAVVAWRRQKLPGTERQTSELAVPGCPDLRGRPTKKEGVFTRVLGIGKKQPMSTR